MTGIPPVKSPDSVIFLGLYGRAVGVRCESNVIRWHTASTNGDVKDTVASHTFEVMKAAWTIAQLLLPRGYSINIALLLELAMFHDIEEETTGEFPHSYKASMSPSERKEFDRQIGVWASEAIKYRFAPFLHTLVQQRWETARQKGSLEAQIVAVADCMSAVSFLEEQAVQRGNSALRKAFLEDVRELTVFRGVYQWLGEVWELIFGQTPEEILA